MWNLRSYFLTFSDILWKRNNKNTTLCLVMKKRHLRQEVTCRGKVSSASQPHWHYYLPTLTKHTQATRRNKTGHGCRAKVREACHQSPSSSQLQWTGAFIITHHNDKYNNGNDNLTINVINQQCCIVIRQHQHPALTCLCRCIFWGKPLPKLHFA